MALPPALVSDAAGVAAAVQAARAAGSCAIDTEFLWEKTYAPQLCLAQLAVGDEIWLIDPLAGAPLDPVAELVADPAVEKLMHAPSADLIAFGLHFGSVPANVFDTQIAAGFVGLTAGAGLERLLDQVLRVRLDHDETFSDWSRRPLTDTQLLYAADDVRHLAALVAELRRRLDERGRTAWAQAEIERRFCVPEAAGADPERAWRKVQRRGRLSPTAQAVLIEVAAWRERAARRRDQPAAWVVKDPTLVEIARAAPQSAEQLRRIRGLGKGLNERDPAALLAAVEAGRGRTPPPKEASVPQRVARRVETVATLAVPMARIRCLDQDLAPELVATRADLDRFLEAVVVGEGADELPLGQGWRRELLGDDLIRLASGEVALSLNREAPYLRIEDRDGR
ncbi:MAG: ribonuclease D [Gaiellales bacterium]